MTFNNNYSEEIRARQADSGWSRRRGDSSRSSTVESGAGGFDSKLPNRGVREFVGRGRHEEVAPAAVRAVEEISSARLDRAKTTHSLARVGAELVVRKEREGKAASYTVKLKRTKNYILPGLGTETPVEAVTRDDLKRFRQEISQGDLELRTCNRILVTIRQVLKLAEDAGYCDLPPLPRNFPESLKDVWKRWQILDPAQITTMLGFVPPEVRPLFAYLANTGLRVGTALLTEVSWIDWSNHLVRYPASAMKGGRPHSVELNGPAEAALRQAIESSPSKPFPYSYWFALSRWTAAREKAGFPDLRIHDLRHSFGVQPARGWHADSRGQRHGRPPQLGDDRPLRPRHGRGAPERCGSSTDPGWAVRRGSETVEAGAPWHPARHRREARRRQAVES